MRSNPVLVFLAWVSVSGLLAFLLLQPKFKAETYTRLTGKKVSYWDAMWVDLRIQEQVR